MPKPTVTADLLAEAGRLLYGETGWVGPLSEDTGIAARTIYAWTSGKRELAANNTIMQKVEDILRVEAAVTLALADRIKAHAAKAQPRKVPVGARKATSPIP